MGAETLEATLPPDDNRPAEETRQPDATRPPAPLAPSERPRAAQTTVAREPAAPSGIADSVPPGGAPDPVWRSRHERYHDVARIGKGGMGEVRRVRDQAFGRLVAMKILP